MNCGSYDEFFGNFSNRTKLKIVMLLRKKPLSVSELAEAIGEEQSKVSHNLTKLTKCNIIFMKKEGKRRIYSLNKDTVIPMLNLVDEHVHKHCNRRCK